MAAPAAGEWFVPWRGQCRGREDRPRCRGTGVIRDIVRYGDPRLLAPNEETDPAGADLPALIADLFDTCRAAPGIGLAAPQIGVNRRVAVIDLSVGADSGARIAMVNSGDHRGLRRAEGGGGLPLDSRLRREGRSPGSGEGTLLRREREDPRDGGHGPDGARSLPRDRSPQRRAVRGSAPRVEARADLAQDREDTRTISSKKVKFEATVSQLFPSLELFPSSALKTAQAVRAAIISNNFVLNNIMYSKENFFCSRISEWMV